MAVALFAPGASAQNRLGRTPTTTVKADDALGGGIVADGSFEAGTPNPFWDEASSSFGTPVCDLASCGLGGGTGPRTGGFWVWFGGAPTGDVGSMEQDVTIPAAGSASLNFYLEIPLIAAGGTGFVAVKMDGTEIFRATYAADQATYATYALVTVPVGTYADGNSHALRFESTTTGSGNFFVDDVSIDAAISGPSLAVSPTSVAFGNVQMGETATQTVTLTNNGTAPVAVASAVVTGSPAITATGGTGTIAPGASATVTLTFTPTTTGAATGTLTITSNAPNSPQTVALTGTGIGPDTSVRFESADTPIAIPDNDPTGITSTITVPASDARSVADADIDLDVTHTWVGDLIATVSHTGASVTIVDQPGAPASTFGCSSNNMVIIADDEGTAGTIEGTCGATTGDEAYTTGGRYTPNNPLTAFDGTAFAGMWTLNISDNAGGDTGTLNSWALLLTPIQTANGETAGSVVSRLAVAPNPVVGSAQIDLTVATTQDVRVALYDALGREVAVLFDRTMTAGQQAYIAMTTTSLPSGVYVVRATGTDLSLTQRVTVVR